MHKSCLRTYKPFFSTTLLNSRDLRFVELVVDNAATHSSKSFPYTTLCQGSRRRRRQGQDCRWGEILPEMKDISVEKSSSQQLPNIPRRQQCTTKTTATVVASSPSSTKPQQRNQDSSRDVPPSSAPPCWHSPPEINRTVNSQRSTEKTRVVESSLFYQAMQTSSIAKTRLVPLT